MSNGTHGQMRRIVRMMTVKYTRKEDKLIAAAGRNHAQ